MGVNDLIPWRHASGSELSSRGAQDPVAALQNDVNRAFDDFLRLFSLPFSGWPASLLSASAGLQGSGIQLDFAETDKEVRITAELPGMNESDIDIRVSDNMLVISGEKKADRNVEAHGYILRERSFGRVERSLPLPDGIDVNAAQAVFKSGVITLTIPKTAEAQGGAKRIPVRSD